MAMGLDAGWQYEQRTVQLEPGDWLFLYTDGVTDAVNAAGQSYDETALIECLAEHCRLGAAEILARLDQSLCSFVGDRTPFDDITTMVLRRQ
jgi:sigma-B regulation protein RsbU (phosphoserine phosphatase)